MKSSHRQQLAGITMMATGAVIGGGSVSAEVDDPIVYAMARDAIVAIVGGDQDGTTQQDGKDTLLWVLDPTRDRGAASIQLVWNHGRQASKPTGGDDVIDLATARARRDHETAESRLEHLLRESLKPCAICNRTRGTHTRAERAVCDAIANTQPQPPAGA